MENILTRYQLTAYDFDGPGVSAVLQVRMDVCVVVWLVGWLVGWLCMCVCE